MRWGGDCWADGADNQWNHSTAVTLGDKDWVILLCWWFNAAARLEHLAGGGRWSRWSRWLLSATWHRGGQRDSTRCGGGGGWGWGSSRSRVGSGSSSSLFLCLLSLIDSVVKDSFLVLFFLRRHLADQLYEKCTWPKCIVQKCIAAIRENINITIKSKHNCFKI